MLDIPGKRGSSLVRSTKATIGLFFIVMFAFLFAAGCGDDGAGDTSTAGRQTSTISFELTRPSPGTVEVVDPPGDAKRDDGTPVMNRSAIDIERVSIAGDGGNLVFSQSVGETIPTVRPAGLLGIEWGYLLDADSDGEPDWGLYVAFPQGQLAYGLYNQKTKERMQDDQFPGTFSLDGSSFAITLRSDAIGSPQSFQWIAYTDAATNPESDDEPIRKVSDSVPADAWPNGSNWLPYP
jgi:hypothetical protein